MKHWYRLSILLFLCLVLPLSACSGGGAPEPNTAAQQPAQAEPAQAATATDEPEVELPAPTEPLPVPSATPEPSPTPPPAEPLTQAELQEKWQPPLASYSLFAGACASIQDTLTEQIDHGLSGISLEGSWLGIDLVMGAAEQAIDAWEPDPALAGYYDDLQGSLEMVKGLLGKWQTEALTAEAVQGALVTECQAVDSTAETLLETARAEGITAETLEAIGEELMEQMGSLMEAAQAAQPVSVEPGQSRKDPFPLGQVVSLPNWDIQVLEIKQGKEAWQLIEAENPYTEPAADGMEYVLVRIKVKNTAAADEERSISSTDFGLTGSKLIQYGSPFVMPPSPALNAKLFPGGEAEGWLVLQAALGETNRMLVFQELVSSGGPYFFALDEGASLVPASDLTGIQPTEAGLARADAAPFGEAVVSEDWEVAVMEVKRGEEAWQMLLEANSYNDPAPDGMEYVLVRVKSRYIGTAEAAEYISGASFQITGSSNQLNDAAWVVVQPALDARLFPGGEQQGWVALVAETGETDLILVYEPFMSFDESQRRYLALEP